MASIANWGMCQWFALGASGTVRPMVVDQHSLDELSAEQLREMAARLMGQLRHQSALLEKLSYENALLKRMKFAAQSERFNTEQRSLLEDEIDADLAAVPSPDHTNDRMDISVPTVVWASAAGGARRGPVGVGVGASGGGAGASIIGSTGR